MTRLSLALAALGAALLAPGVASAAPIDGLWKKGNLVIRIAPCGAAHCGTVVRASAKQQARAERGSGTDLIGATLIKDIRPVSAGRYRARVFVADKNIHASGTIQQPSANQLDVRGCVMGVICKTAQWRRIG